ncbi:7810_t:CDS:2, partial [Dentiscutata erythropus]
MLILIEKVLSQDSCHLSPTKPKTIIGYYPAYSPNNLKPGIDFDINLSINHLNYIAFGPNDLVNNGNNTNPGGDPYAIMSRQSQFSKLNDLKNYKTKNNLNFTIILSVLLPTDASNLTQLLYVGSGPNSSVSSGGTALM